MMAAYHLTGRFPSRAVLPECRDQQEPNTHQGEIIQQEADGPRKEQSSICLLLNTLYGLRSYLQWGGGVGS